MGMRSSGRELSNPGLSYWARQLQRRTDAIVTGPCPLHPEARPGEPAAAASWCRVAGHGGSCHRHFSGVIGRRPHTAVLRATGQALECTAGADLDQADTPASP